MIIYNKKYGQYNKIPSRYCSQCNQFLEIDSITIAEGNHSEIADLFGMVNYGFARSLLWAIDVKILILAAVYNLFLKPFSGYTSACSTIVPPNYP